MSNEVATQNRSQKLAAYFEERADLFKSLMPEGQVARFLRVVNNAILRDPKIADASTQSIFLECQKCANDGLVLDGREAALVTFKTNKKVKNAQGRWEDNWQTEVVYIPMIRGLTKLINASPQIADWHTGLVYEEEYRQNRFEYMAGDQPRIDHHPIIIGDRGPVVAAYSVARLRNGSVKIEVMTLDQLDKIKNRTKSQRKVYANGKDTGETEITGPWKDDPEEMYRKTVARRHFKSLPLEGKAETAINRVDELYDFDAKPERQEPVAPAPKAIANKRTGSAAAKLKAAAKPKPGPDDEGDPVGDERADVIDHDPATGEVEDADIVDDDAAMNADDEF